MAITNKEEGVWILPQVYNKQMEGDIWDYTEVLELYSWGYNSAGNLGQNNRTNQSSPIQVPGTTWNSTGHSRASTSFATKTDGTLWSWGGDNYGMGGTGGANEYMSSPTQIGDGTDWSQGDNNAISGHDFSLFVKTDGTMFGAGRNNQGQLGLNNKTDQSSPTQVGGEDGWSAVSGCYNSSMALRTDGTLWSWGNGSYGKLGHNQSMSSYSSPKQVGTDTTWSIITGNGNFAAIKTDGTLWSWGFNREGQLGHNTGGNPGTYASVSSPKQLPGTWQDVSTMREGAYAVTTDGKLYAWGRNQFGELGLNQFWNPTNNGISSPTQVGTDTTWQAVSAGTYTCFASKTDGSLWAWGRNINGGGGFNDGGNKYSSPVQLPGNWVATAGSFNGTTTDGAMGLKKT